MIRTSPYKMVLASGARLGPYEIIGTLGAGGMGEVYRALVFDPKTGSPDLWVVRLSDDRKPSALLDTLFGESHGQISPDGKWLAYYSNETGPARYTCNHSPAEPASDRSRRTEVCFHDGDTPGASCST